MTPKKELNADVRRSGRRAAPSGKQKTLNMVKETVIAKKRTRKPNLRYVDDANIRPESKEDKLRGSEVTAISKIPTHGETGTIGTDKKSKKSRKRKSVQYEVNCCDITGMDIKAFVRIFLFVDLTEPAMISLLFLPIPFSFSKPT